MAEIFPDEGLDYLLGITPKNGSNLATTYLLLCTGATASTVPAANAVLSTYTGVAEAGFTSYARQSIAAASWGAVGAKTIWTQSARGVTAAQVSFPAAGAAYGTAINFFGLCDVSGHGSEKGLFYSNFDDSTGIASLALGDVVKVTPTYGYLG